MPGRCAVIMSHVVLSGGVEHAEITRATVSPVLCATLQANVKAEGNKKTQIDKISFYSHDLKT